MGRKPKPTVLDQPELTEQPEFTATNEVSILQPFEINNDPGTPKAERQERISIVLDSEGKPDFTKMRASTVEKFKKAVGESAMSAGNPDVKPRVPDENLMSYEEVAALFDMLGPVEGYAIALIMKVPVPIAMKVFTYTEADKAELVPAAMALANKYGIKQYLGYLEETRFAMVMYKVTTLKLEAMKTLVREEREYKAKMAAYDAPRPVMQPPEQVSYASEPSPPASVVIEQGFAVSQ